MIAVLTACSPINVDPEARIIVYGDSMMDWNRLSAQSTPDQLALLLSEPIQNQAVTAARLSHPLNPLLDIRRQVRDGNWAVAIVNGGANDMIFECGCGPCQGTVDRVISSSGQDGQLPTFLRALRDEGAEVIYSGYHRPRNMGSPVRACRNEVEELEARVARLAKAEPGITFASLAEAFPPGDTSYYDFDRFHPSIKGSERLAKVLEPYVRAALSRAARP